MPSMPLLGGVGTEDAFDEGGGTAAAAAIFFAFVVFGERLPVASFELGAFSVGGA